MQMAHRCKSNGVGRVFQRNGEIAPATAGIRNKIFQGILYFRISRRTSLRRSLNVQHLKQLKLLILLAFLDLGLNCPAYFMRILGVIQPQILSTRPGIISKVISSILFHVQYSFHVVYLWHLILRPEASGRQQRPDSQMTTACARNSRQLMANYTGRATSQRSDTSRLPSELSRATCLGSFRSRRRHWSRSDL